MHATPTGITSRIHVCSTVSGQGSHHIGDGVEPRAQLQQDERAVQTHCTQIEEGVPERHGHQHLRVVSELVVGTHEGLLVLDGALS